MSLLFLPSAPKEAAPGDPGPSSITFFAFSLIEGYISIVMDAETQKKYVTPNPRWVTDPKPGTGRKEVEHQALRSPGPPPSSRFPSNLLLTSSSGELWRMVRIGGQPLGFGEGRSLCWGLGNGLWGDQGEPYGPFLNPQMNVGLWPRSQVPWLRPTSLPTTSAPLTLTTLW